MMLCASAEASSSFFDDVPANDQSYQIVNELISTGKVSGYPKPIPDGRVLSRIEMAMIIDAADKNSSDFTPAQQEQLALLKDEYLYDIKKYHLLHRLDTIDEGKLDSLENKPTEGEPQFTPEETAKIKTLANRFEVSGYAEIRHDTMFSESVVTDANGVYQGVNKKKIRSTPSSYVKAELQMRYKINDDWKAVTGIQYRGNSDKVDDWGVSGGENVSSLVPTMWLEGKFAKNAHLKIGRWNEWTPWGWGYDIDCDITGAQFEIGKPIFKTVLTAGKIDLWDNYMLSGYLRGRGYKSDEETNFLGVRFDYYHPNHKLDAHFGIHGMSAMTSRYQDPEKKRHPLYYYAHAGYKFDDNWRAHFGMIHSNAKGIDHPWGTGGPQASRVPGIWAQVWYKNADPAKPGTYSAWLKYRREPGLTWVTVTDWWPINTEGLRLGFDYVVAKNMIIGVWGDRMKEIDTGAKSQRYRVQLTTNFE